MIDRRGDYGYDAPYALVTFAALGAGAAIGAVFARWARRTRQTAILGLYALFFLANALSFFYTTRRGKFLVWTDILDELRLDGGERVLDIGCGRRAHYPGRRRCRPSSSRLAVLVRQSVRRHQSGHGVQTDWCTSSRRSG